MVEAAKGVPVVAATAYSFRRNPAIEAIREHLADGTLGTPALIEAHYLADYAADPNGPMSWRFRGGLGTGALADLGAHIIDLAEYVCGPVESVSGADLAISIPERNLPVGSVIGHDHAELSDETESVTNDDSAVFTARFASGAVGTFRVSRVAYGQPNDLALTLTGIESRAEFDWRRPAEFIINDTQPSPETRGDRVVYVGPGTASVFDDAVPMPGGNISFGYGDLFIYQARAFLDQILERESRLPRCASFEDGLHTMRVLDAITRSHRENGTSVTV